MDSYSHHVDRISQVTLDRHAPREMFVTHVESVIYDGRFVNLTVRPTAAQQLSYAVPGQYVVARFADGQPRFVALYGNPQAALWEFLFEPKPEWDLSQFAPGTSIPMSLADGHGYPTKFEASAATVFVSGSGIASVLPWLKATPEVDHVELFYALDDSAPQTLERTHSAVSNLSGEFHLVSPQDMSHHAAVSPANIENHAVLLCGSPRMVRDVAEVLLARGIHHSQIYTNLG